MITPSSAPIETSASARPRRGRHRRPVRFALAVVVALGLTTSLTSCSPEEVARSAVEQYWGGNSNCAMRIVARESGYRADAVNSSSGARGLFQMMPLHSGWISAEMGYSWGDMFDAGKNAHAAKRLSDKAYAQTGDGWWPWRIGGQARPGGGCPA